MLYLEDYLESKYFVYVFATHALEEKAHNLNLISVIEHLPQELRDRFTDMREMDLAIHSKFLRAIFSFTSLFMCDF